MNATAPQIRSFQEQIAQGVGRVTVQLTEMAGRGELTAASIIQSFAQMAQAVINQILQTAIAQLILFQIGAIASTIFTPWMIPILIAAGIAISALIAQLSNAAAGRGGGGGAPAPPLAGSIAGLQERRRALIERRENTTNIGDITRINQEIAAIDEEIRRLQQLGIDGGGTTPDGRRAPREMQFGGTPQSVQLAVATPLLTASTVMLDAANIMRDTFASMMPGGQGFGSLPPFTDAIARMTPVLERLLVEGVSINVGTSAASTQQSSLAYLR
jgi:hypothetical protein